MGPSPPPAAADRGGAASASEEARIQEELRVYRLTAHVWVHESMGRLPDGAVVPANGLVIVSNREAALVDTTWSDAQAHALLGWVEGELGAQVRYAVITHSHRDRSGGIRAILSRGIRAVALESTVRLAGIDGWEVGTPTTHLVSGVERLAVGDASVEVFFPGAGHAQDNVVAWVREDRVLFGGCMIKSADAEHLGNLRDADLRSWPTALRTLRARYPELERVVPGHGAPADASLLTHTLELLERATAAPGDRRRGIGSVPRSEAPLARWPERRR